MTFVRRARILRRPSGRALVVVGTVGVVLLLSLVILSPLALPWLAGERTDWATSANIGQAYGGVAAVLAGLALCGVVVSIVIQRRQLAIQLNLAVRERQFDLTRTFLEHPHAAAKLLGSGFDAETALLNLYVAQFWLV